MCKSICPCSSIALKVPRQALAREVNLKLLPEIKHLNIHITRSRLLMLLMMLMNLIIYLGEQLKLMSCGGAADAHFHETSVCLSVVFARKENLS